jgi:HTH-type transcriptional regulator / antitoxin HipB
MAMEYPIRNAMQLAQALKGGRKARKLTQAQAGKLVGLLPKTVSALEGDPDGSTIGSLLKMLSALDLEMTLRPKPSIRKKPDAAGTAPSGEW